MKLIKFFEISFSQQEHFYCKRQKSIWCFCCGLLPWSQKPPQKEFLFRKFVQTIGVSWVWLLLLYPTIVISNIFTFPSCWSLPPSPDCLYLRLGNTSLPGSGYTWGRPVYVAGMPIAFIYWMSWQVMKRAGTGPPVYPDVVRTFAAHLEEAPTDLWASNGTCITAIFRFTRKPGYIELVITVISCHLFLWQPSYYVF